MKILLYLREFLARSKEGEKKMEEQSRKINPDKFEKSKRERKKK